MSRFQYRWRSLAIDPTPGGIAYVVLEGTTRLVAWGFIEPKTTDPTVLEKRIHGLWERYQPALLVLERDLDSRRGERALARIALAESVAAERSRAVIKVSRDEVRLHFAGRALSKEAIAKVLVRDFPELRSWAPRKFFDKEDPRMKLFTALSFAVTAITPLEGSL